MNILVIDGQGGKMGRLLIEEILARLPDVKVTAVGTNSVATAAMLKAGAVSGATGENPVSVMAARADVILGPVGIVIADALLGEVTPRIALAVGRSRARKILLPYNRCDVTVIGTQGMNPNEAVRQAVEQLAAMVSE
ncbi:MAG: DUF3842 family protein [Eubacteriales bacterium]|jgi:hypothetical protein